MSGQIHRLLHSNFIRHLRNLSDFTQQLFDLPGNNTFWL